MRRLVSIAVRAAAIALIHCAAVANPLRAAEPATLDDARGMLLSGKYAEAAEAYERLADDAPLAATLGLVECDMATGALDEARGRLESVVERFPDSAPPHAVLARIAFDRGDYDMAEREVQAALALDSNLLSARWTLAELARVRGKLDDAGKAYEWFVDFYNDNEVGDAESLHFIGLGAAQYARWNRLSDQFPFLVNELYPDALALDPTYWPAAAERGRLFLEKYNQAEASQALRSALELNANAATVHAALAMLALQSYELDAARQSIDRALEINPRLLEAHLARADVLLADFRASEAVAALEAARDINPVSEALLGRLAAAYFIVDGEALASQADSRTTKLTAEVLTRNERAGEYFICLAAALDATRHFPAAAENYRIANERMPPLIEPMSALGLLYMRLGDEVEAKKFLELAFEADPFHVRVSNSLKVLEVLDGYETLETEHFIFKYDGERDALLIEYVARYLEDEVYPELTAKFGFEPQGKSLFEFFSRAKNTAGHGWFSARLVGLPYIGTVGACAGKMVALASPNDMPEKYNWARVVKHEFVHVLNLQQSNFNIPHWYTEALAVQSEGFPRPQVWDDLLAERVPKGEIFNLDTINLGFIRPSSSLDWQMAYCQAQLYAQYMLATYGDDALAKLLTAYADNLETPAALKRCFDVDKDDFERGYRQHLESIVATLSTRRAAKEESFAALVRAHEAQPDDVDIAARLAIVELDRKRYAEARRLAESIFELDERNQLAAYVRSRVHLVVGENDEAIAVLEKCLDREKPEPRLVNLLAAFRLKEEDYDAAIELYQFAAKADPANRDWTKSLVRAYLLAGREEPLAALLERMAAWEADDATVRKRLARMSLEGGDFEAAARWANEILHIDVMDAEAHRLLAEAKVGGHDDRLAAREFEVAIELSPDDIASRLGLAKARIRLGEPEVARATLEALLKISPGQDDAIALLETLAP